MANPYVAASWLLVAAALTACAGDDDSGLANPSNSDPGQDSGAGGADSSTGQDAAPAADAEPEAGQAGAGGSAGWGGSAGERSYCDDPEPGFNESSPGFHLFVDLGVAVLMGQNVGFAVAGFMPTAREDYCNEPPGLELALDTCTTEGSVKLLPQCQTKADCAPEQDCQPETDNNGSPIPGTEQCVTARQLINVGPFTMQGFATGPQTFQYNAGQSGAYTITSDGQIPPEWLAWDADYTFSGAGDASKGIGPFQGSVHVPPQLVLTAPPQVPLPMGGMPGLEVNPMQDLELRWQGGTGQSELVLNLSGGMSGKTASCRVKNDGSFTVPSAVLQQIQLGDIAFLNMMEMTTEVAGQASGTGLTRTRVTVTQALTINLIKK